jgi:hypothetical protein
LKNLKNIKLFRRKLKLFLLQQTFYSVEKYFSRSVNMEDVIVYKRRTYFRQFEIERGRVLVHILSVVPTLVGTPSK